MARVPSIDALAALVATSADGETPTARLRRAVDVSRQLAERGDELIELFVADARGAGASWTEIGEAFGTSKQAAQQRYAAGRLEPGSWPGRRWAPAARGALERAAEQARVLRHDCIGTEHVLAGLLAEDGLAAEVLGELGVTNAGILAQAQPGPREPQPAACVGVMPRLKRALELAVRLAEQHGHRHADSEHLLAAITQIPEARAIELLEAVGVSAADVHAALARRLDVDPASLLLARRRMRRRGVPSC